MRCRFTHVDVLVILERRDDAKRLRTDLIPDDETVGGERVEDFGEVHIIEGEYVEDQDARLPPKAPLPISYSP